MTANTILQIEDLRTHFHDRKVVLKAVDGVDLRIERGEILGLVGESGCGKTTLALSILNLVPHPGYVESGRILFGGRDILRMPKDELRDLRGRQISMIFQDPIAGLNPILTVGDQVGEIITAHSKASRNEARRQAVDLLGSMGLAEPERIAGRYPFQLSGGMAQRVMIAIAMALRPTVRIAEEGSPELLYRRPRHPYTWALFESLPRLNEDVSGRLRQVYGRPPDMTKLPPQCAFLPRCPKAMNDCRNLDSPPLTQIEPGHYVACYNPIYHRDDNGDEAEEACRHRE